MVYSNGTFGNSEVRGNPLLIKYIGTDVGIENRKTEGWEINQRTVLGYNCNFGSDPIFILD